MTSLNMRAIQTVTVGSGGAANIEFTNIPQTYTDLEVLFSIRGSTSAPAASIVLYFNGSNANFTSRYLEGDGASAGSYTSPATFGGSANADTSTASTFSSHKLYIPNYTSSNFKSFSIDSVSENSATTAFAALSAGLWSQTAAITSITIDPAGSALQYSTATLYGITSAATGAKATGGIITVDANYFYHTFTASGTFTPTQSLTVDYLVVAGGGAGGGEPSNRYAGGGGGAGGLRCTVGATGGGGSLESPLSLTATNYTVTIGAGGTGNLTKGTNGSNSVFGSITSTGGGAGGSANDVAPERNGATGGSGGGIGGAGGTSGAGTTNQGYRGGNASYVTGGGGAGASGGDSIISAGGIGIATSISGTSTYYGGGGGGGAETAGTGTGGAGGLGGGGAGGGTGTAGTANTGGGGGGSGQDNVGGINGGNGGSGIVIVRYAR